MKLIYVHSKTSDWTADILNTVGDVFSFTCFIAFSQTSYCIIIGVGSSYSEAYIRCLIGEFCIAGLPLPCTVNTGTFWVRWPGSYCAPSWGIPHISDLTTIKISSIHICMLVLLIQLPSCHSAFSPSSDSDSQLSSTHVWLEDWLHPWGGMYLHGYIYNRMIVDLLSPENVVLPGLGLLTSCFNLRMLSAWWPSECKLPNHNEGQAPPYLFLSTLRFEQLGQTISDIPFRLPSYFCIPEHACVIILGVFVSP